MTQEEKTGLEWIGSTLATNSQLIGLLIHAQFLSGTIKPDRVAKVLRDWQRMLEKERDEDKKVSAGIINAIRRELFGENDSKIASLRSELNRAQRRKKRAGIF
jgi:hypothetical protein